MNKHVVWHRTAVSNESRALQKQQPFLLWFTGLSGSGKSTIANGVDAKLFKQGFHTALLDGDNVRHGLCSDLGFSEVDRAENLRRVGEVCSLMMDAGLIVLATFISPSAQERKALKEAIGDRFIEVFIDTPVEVCEQRDPKGLYQKARNGEIKAFTGISAPYDLPAAPDVHVRTSTKTIDACIDRVIESLVKQGRLSQ